MEIVYHTKDMTGNTSRTKTKPELVFFVITFQGYLHAFYDGHEQDKQVGVIFMRTSYYYSVNISFRIGLQLII